VGSNESISFISAQDTIGVDISQSEEVVEDGAGVAEVESEDITEDSDGRSPFSGGDGVVLVVVSTEEDSLEDSIIRDVTDKGVFELGNTGTDSSETTVEEVVVVEDDSHIEEGHEGELSKIDSTITVDIGKGKSDSDEGNGGLLSDKEVDETDISSTEFLGVELAVLVGITGVEPRAEDFVLVVLALEDVGELVLGKDAA